MIDWFLNCQRDFWTWKIFKAINMYFVYLIKFIWRAQNLGIPVFLKHLNIDSKIS